jgi:hypothetical protein
VKRILLAAALAFSACSPSAEKSPETAIDATPTPGPSVEPAAPTPASADAITAEGWGPLRIGMSEQEVIAALGADRNPDAVGGPDEAACNEYRPERAPDGLWVMIQEGKLTRITIAELSALKTDKGFGLGDAADAVKAAYGDQATASPHKYQDKPAEYVTVWSGGPRSEPYVEDEKARGIVYEIDGTGKVGAIHAGGPSIQYVEGCA